MADSVLGVNITATSSFLQRELDRSSQSVNRWAQDVTNSVNNVNATLGRIAEGFRNVATTIGLAELLRRTIDAMVEFDAQAVKSVLRMKDQAEATGLSVKEFQRYQAQALESSASTEKLGSFIARFQQRLGQAQEGSKQLYEAYQRLGVYTLDVTGKHRDWEQVLPEVSRALLKVTDMAERQRLATIILGAGARESGSMLKAFAMSTEEGEKALKKINPVTEEVAENLEKMKVRVEQAHTKISNLWVQFSTPIKMDILEGIAAFFEKIGNIIDRVRTKTFNWLAMIASAGNPIAFFATLAGQTGEPTSVEKLVALRKDEANIIGKIREEEVKRDQYGAGSPAYKAAEERIRQLDDQLRLTQKLMDSESGIPVQEVPAATIVGGGNKRPDGQGGGKTIEQLNWFTEFKRGLDQALEAEENWYKNSKEFEQTYWEDKKAYFKTNYDYLFEELKKRGNNDIQAKNSLAQTEKQIDSALFQAKKANALSKFQLEKQAISESLGNLTTEYSQRQVTESEWLERSKKVINDWAENLKAKGLEGTAEWNAMLKQMENLDKQHANNVRSVWDGIFGWIDSNIQTMVNGVLQGTKTWTQFLQGFFRDMASSFIVEVGKMTVRWLAFKVATGLGAAGVATAIGNPIANLFGTIGTALGGVGGAAKGAGDAAGKVAQSANTEALGKNTAATENNSSGVLDMAAQAVAWVGSAIGLIFATTPSTVSSEAVAAAIFSLDIQITLLISQIVALTIALQANAASNVIPGLATGAWNVPGDMHAIIHQGEMVVPKFAAEALRSGNGLNFGSSNKSSVGAAPAAGVAGGGGIAIHIHAIDAPGVQRLFMNNGGVLARSLSEQVRNGNTSFTSAAHGTSRMTR